MSAFRLSIVALPALALLAACGDGSSNEVVQTNTGNVILNDAQANYAFENDEVANTLAEDMNAMDADNAVMTNGTYGSMTEVPDNAM